MLAAPIAPFTAEAQRTIKASRSAISGLLIVLTLDLVIVLLFELWVRFGLFAYVLNQLSKVELNHSLPRPRIQTKGGYSHRW